VENVRQMGLDVAGRAEMYFACTQPAASSGYCAPRDLAVRVAGEQLRAQPRCSGVARATRLLSTCAPSGRSRLYGGATLRV